MDARLADRFFASRPYRENDMLFCYVSTEIEVDTREILRRAIADGKTVAVPRCVDGTREMDFYILQFDSPEDLLSGRSFLCTRTSKENMPASAFRLY